MSAFIFIALSILAQIYGLFLGFRKKIDSIPLFCIQSKQL